MGEGEGMGDLGYYFTLSNALRYKVQSNVWSLWSASNNVIPAKAGIQKL